jgi:uncharacterized membrane protein YbhN (UPF0104 family)
VNTSISMLIAGLLVGVVGVVLGAYILLNHDGGYPWFYWIAPLLAIGFAFVMMNLTAQYFLKVHRLETKGRPKK